jgi:predicted transcriptional regulator
MKKITVIVVLVMAVLAVNAQVSHTAVKASDLPKAITDNIASHYAGFTIKEAHKVTDNNVVSYNVMINKGTTNETLVYDKDGKFLRKMTPPTASTSSANHKQGTHAAPARK